jgi:DNA replication protein DnaC
LTDRTELRLKPKQAQFFANVLDRRIPNSGFIGGLGSGKTVVGTATTLALLMRYPGIRILLTTR